jgi:hypothetical protein
LVGLAVMAFLLPILLGLAGALVLRGSPERQTVGTLSGLCIGFLIVVTMRKAWLWLKR